MGDHPADPQMVGTLNALLWMITVAFLGGCSLVFKQILKPWSDAKLRQAEAEYKKSEAFVKHVESMAPAMGDLKGMMASLVQFMEQTITRNTVASNTVTESNLKLANSVDKLIEAFGSDPMNNICRLQQIKDKAKAEGVDLSKLTDDQILAAAKRANAEQLLQEHL